MHSILSRALPLSLAMALSLGVAGQAMASDAAKAEQLIEITGAEDSVAMMQQQLMQGAVQRFMMQAQQRELTEAQVNSARPAMEQIFQDIQTTLSWETMRPDIVRIHSEVFTTAEMDAALAFFNSAEGRAFMEKQSRLMERSGEVAERRVAEAMPRFEAAIEAAVQAAAAAPRGEG